MKIPMRQIKPERTETISFRVSSEEKKIIERLAAKQKVSVSQYALTCILMDMLTSGDSKAMKHATSMFGIGVRSAIRDLVHGKENEDPA